MIKYLLINLTIFFVTFSFAQSFTKDKDKFHKDWGKFQLDSRSEEFCKKELEDLVKSAKFSDSKFSKLVDGCNNLEKKGLPVSTDVFNYMISFLFQNINKFDNEFNQDWAELLLDFQNNKQDQLSDFLLFSANLFRFKALMKDVNYGWYYLNGNLNWQKEKDIKIRCEGGDLLCRVPIRGTKGDSIRIESTSGVFDFSNKRWDGRGGIVTWEKTLIKKDETFASLKGYRVDLNKTSLKVDTVLLTTPYFQQPILGKLNDKTILDLSEGEKVPHFVSFEKRLKIPNLRKNIDYDGSFTLEGDEFVGKGVEGRPAKLIFKVLDKKQVEVSALDYKITPKKILSNDCSFKLIYKTSDTLYLQKGILVYDLSTEEMKITSGNVGGVNVPFWDSYFQIYIKSSVFMWNMNKNKGYFTFDVGTSQEQRFAIFESKDNFDGRLYAKYKPTKTEHPFQLISKKIASSGKKEFTEGELASAMNSIVDQIKPLLVDMMADGFVHYNSVMKKIKIEQKLLDYAMAQNGDKDYDNLIVTSDFRPIKFSFTEEDIQNNPELLKERNRLNERNRLKQLYQAFALLNIEELELFINEVDEIVLSEGQKVSIYCDSSRIKMKKNRDLYFSGWATAGKLDLYCKNAFFDYENYKLNILASRDAYFNFNPLKSEDGPAPIASPSSISHLTGEILIDNPLSRSGKRAKTDEYPILKSRLNSKVYYNDKSILKGAYDSTRFYYDLIPFEFDSLDNFKEKALAFDGELISGGIFPPLKEKLVIMNDYSLGFFTNAPESGLSFYGTETKYKNKIALSNNGLQGTGTIEYMKATAVSKLLTFLPDSTIGIAEFKNLQNDQDVKFPEAHATAALISYQPKNGILKVSSYNNQLISMFNEEINLTGTLVIQKNGSTGAGHIDLKEASLVANDFKFTNQEIDTDSSNFSLRNRFSEYGENPLAIQSDGVKGHISFKERLGKFNSSSSKRIKFPANDYYCQMDKFIWQMDGEAIDFEKNGSSETNFESDNDLEQNNFFSLLPEQDSLQFKSLSASYDLKTQTINCYKVEYVQVGDARIYPDSMKIKIKKSAKMDPLVNANITANYISKFHQFTEANVSITSRFAYEGNCKFPFYDRDSVLSIIPMKTVQYRKDKKQTVAEGDIPEDKILKLSKEFDYFGKVSVFASTPGLYLNGSTRLSHKCNYDKSWFNFSDTINTKRIQIPVSENLKNNKNQSILSGFAWRNSLKLDSLRVYTGFLSKKENDNDVELVSAKGYVQFNDAADEFQIGTKDRLAKKDSLSLLYTLHLGTCIVSSFGPINIGINYGETNLNAYGKLEYNPNDKKTTSYLNLSVNMQLPKETMEIIANKIKADENIKEIDLKAGKYGLKNTFAYWLNGDHEKVFKDYDEDRLKKMPEKLNATFIFSGLKLESLIASASGGRKAERGFITDKNSKIGLVSISGIPVLREVNTKLFLAQRHSSDETQFFGINLEVNDEKFFYLNHQMDNKKEATLSFVSNDSDLKKSILAIKPKKRKAKNFKFDLAEGSDATNLIAKFKSVFQYK